MTIRPNVELRPDFPDDMVEDDDEIVQWPGRNIAEALREGLQGQGYRVSEPIHAHEHGWELDVWRGRKRLWIQITRMSDDECCLMTENMTFWLWPDMNVYRAFLSDLQRVLEADQRFSRIGWLPDRGWDNGVAPSAGPFDD